MFSPRCRKCERVLTFKNISTLRNINGKSIVACKACEEDVIAKLKKDKEVEIYNGHPIYKYDNFFIPYWACVYGFEKIEDCRRRMDDKNIAYFPEV